MGRLDSLFGTGKEGKRDVETLEEIESRLNEGDLSGALHLVDVLKNPGNVFLALRLILKRIAESAREPNANRTALLAVLREAIPRVNAVPSERYRAILLGELAKAFYYLGDDFNGDISLKTALNLASNHPDILRDILRGLIEEGLLKKAAYALKMVRDRRALDPIFEYLVERLYHAGKVKDALKVLEHIESPFHRAMALHSLALLSRDDPETALKFIERAIEEASKIEDPETRFETMIKLYDTMHEIKGEPLSLGTVLRATSLSGDGRNEHEDAYYEDQR